MTADTLIVHGRVFGARPEATAVAVSGNRIVGVGTDAELTHLRSAATDVIDARGATVMPGFNDAHMHLRLGALALDQLDLFGLSSVVQIREAISRYASERAAEPWVIGRGWMYGAFPGGLPTRQLLDQVVPDRPAFMACFDAHSAWANSRALELAGIDGSTPDPADGRIVRDDAGEPTGALLERAAELVEAIVPKPDAARRLLLIERALDALAAAGLTAVQDAWAEPADFEALAVLRERRPLPVRLRLAIELLPAATAKGMADVLDHFESITRPLSGDAHVRGGIIKSFLDGVVEARTAYMLEPYPGTDSRGDRRWSDDALRDAVRAAHARGWQLELHAIGPAAVRQALDAFESLGFREARARRHRIEHIETVDPADLPRFAELGVVASMQPLHAIPGGAQLDTWSSQLDPRVAQSGWRMRSLLESGAQVAIGSDWPVVPFNPFFEVHAAVNRQSVDGLPVGGFLAAERISLPDALLAATAGSAYAEHSDTERGRLEPGMLADLIVLDRDLLAEGPSAIADTGVVVTMMDGRAVHRLA